jgi:16S rRNA (guanine(966)-N(2))-methyltransferase RsmD
MRVISGKAKGINLKTLKDLSIRPTTDKVKESIFNIIQFDIKGSVVLDLFAGSGALGIEALSRGAKLAVFVDKDRQALNIIRENLKNTKLTDNSIIIAGDYEKFLQKNQANLTFDIVFLDPPYKQELINIVINKLIACKMLADTAIIICESNLKEQVNETFNGLTLLNKYVYGQTVIRAFIADFKDDV